MKKLITGLLSIILILSVLTLTVHAAPAITFTQKPNAQYTMTVTTGVANEQVSFIAYEGTSLPNNPVVSKFRWIDQKATDASGKAVSTFIVDPTKTDTNWVLASGSGSGTVKKTVYIPRYQPYVSDVPNNYIRIGNDVYSLDNPKLTNQAILDSLKYGGNEVYYKVNGRWYNVLADSATSSSFFTNTGNAETTTSVNNWSLDKYYYKTDPNYYDFVK